MATRQGVNTSGGRRVQSISYEPPSEDELRAPGRQRELQSVAVSQIYDPQLSDAQASLVAGVGKNAAARGLRGRAVGGRQAALTNKFFSANRQQSFDFLQRQLEGSALFQNAERTGAGNEGLRSGLGLLLANYRAGASGVPLDEGFFASIQNRRSAIDLQAMTRRGGNADVAAFYNAGTNSFSRDTGFVGQQAYGAGDERGYNNATIQRTLNTGNILTSLLGENELSHGLRTDLAQQGTRALQTENAVGEAVKYLSPLEIDRRLGVQSQRAATGRGSMFDDQIIQLRQQQKEFRALREKFFSPITR